MSEARHDGELYGDVAFPRVMVYGRYLFRLFEFVRFVGQRAYPHPLTLFEQLLFSLFLQEKKMKPFIRKTPMNLVTNYT